MVARSMVEIATALQDAVDLGLGAEEKFRRLAEAVAEEIQKKFEEIQTEVQQLRNSRAEEETKRKRTESARNLKKHSTERT